jgi:small subunit ribosomal protein S6
MLLILFLFSATLQNITSFLSSTILALDKPGLYYSQGGFMRRYETIFIVDPDLSDEDRTPLFSKLDELIPQQGGFLVMRDEWGLKRLAYEIKKKPRGYYVLLDYCGTGAVVDEMERFFRIDDRVLKYMTVLLDEKVDIDSVKEEMARKASEADLAAQAESVQRDETAAEQKTDEPHDDETVESETTASESNEEEQK